MGPEEWEFVPRDHGMPTAVAGFAPESLLAALYSVLRQKLEGKCFLDNCYPQVVRPGGNADGEALHRRRRWTSSTATGAASAPIPESGYVLKPQYAAHDSRVQLPSYTEMARKRAGEMPPGCDCARVVLGRSTRTSAASTALACTPRQPVGPCMVSDEGACRIWWADGVRENVWAGRKAPEA